MWVSIPSLSSNASFDKSAFGRFFYVMAFNAIAPRLLSVLPRLQLLSQLLPKPLVAGRF